MTTQAMIKLVVMFLLLLAMLFISIAVWLWSNNRAIERGATRKIQGEVVGYSYNGNGGGPPIVAFEVDCKTYRSKLRYRNDMVTSTSFHKEAVVIGDPLDKTLRIKRNRYVSMNPLESHFPIGSSLTVYYNPNNPQQNYVERHAGSLMPPLFLLAGMILVIVSVGLYVVI